MIFLKPLAFERDAFLYGHGPERLMAGEHAELERIAGELS